MQNIRFKCERELGTWTVRINGHFIIDFWSERKARRLTMKLMSVLGAIEDERNAEEQTNLPA